MTGVTNRYRIPLVMRLGRRITPPRALVSSFAALILLGSGVLMVPGMTGPIGLKYIDALFTATSAVCVTGLTVVDTGTAFAFPGQAAILAMIQLGGLGIMTFSVFFYRLAGRSVSLWSELAVRESLSYHPDQDVSGLVRSVIVWTLMIELVGAILLFIAWSNDYPPLEAVYLSVFHSVSAFCNAGFSLWADSLTRYRTHLGVNLIVVALIVAGGLGFIVLTELGAMSYIRRRRLTLHSKLVLWTTGLLILGGTAMFMTLEWDNVLKGLGFKDRFAISLFQAITPRTAGFNTIDFSHLTNATLLMTIMFMFIGGSPGSTAGGIKTVTAALMASLAVSRWRGFSQPNVFRRSVPGEIVSRALTIVLISGAVVAVSVTLLLITQTWDMDHTQTRDLFVQLVFETFSAFGTVGLSMGATGNLTVMGKLIIIVTMFMGRVGPLTVALALMRRSAEGKNYHYGSEDVMVG